MGEIDSSNLYFWLRWLRYRIRIFMLTSRIGQSIRKLIWKLINDDPIKNAIWNKIAFIDVKYLPDAKVLNLLCHGRKDEPQLCLWGRLKEFFGRDYIITPNGRTALWLVLNHLGLSADDEVYISTTYNAPYVSKCVIETIERVCKPSRSLTDRTRVILCIHEFGVPNDIESLKALAKKREIVLIEDCAHTFDSSVNSQKVGMFGDYAFYSLPKLFPVFYGGILVGDKSPSYSPTYPAKLKIRMAKAGLKMHFSHLNEYSRIRREKFRFLSGFIKKTGLHTLFDVNENITPFHFVLSVPQKLTMTINRVCWDRGIENKIWDKEIMVFPLHPFLPKEKMLYVAKSIDLAIFNQGCAG